MTSTLFRLSMLSETKRTVVRSPSPAPPSGDGRGRQTLDALLLRPRLLDVLGDHVLVRGVPVGDLHELAVLHLPDLHEPATLVILRRDLERRHEPAQGEVRDLLEPGLRVDA